MLPEILEIGGALVRLEVFEVSTPSQHPMLLFLHGADGNTRFWIKGLAEHLVPLGVTVCALRYFDSTSTLRADLDPVARLTNYPFWLATIESALNQMGRSPEVDDNCIFLCGFSLGASLAISVAATGHVRLKGVIDLAGSLRDSNKPFSANFPPTLIVHGTADASVNFNHAGELQNALTTLQVPNRFHALEGVGHWFSAEVKASILGIVAQFVESRISPPGTSGEPTAAD